ncbi:type II toxin-antitoxin system VapC family toxin [Actinomycetospora sp. TBRC 11914]|uniref:type II toxin-antitoxin system VapC family toxin n=1 Tax=Actinomycetospora sp. TBRC 11914 TaxID=2729387 RepID=UPI00145D5382|nr:type II toxin-antitoxin system VapC family toxin [Actinomycetospora sp. TBRC 11914]NMO92249.1 type II toxin-antitoxin system VapC family toxin [Actinomycetospora sp. TBRC 11914]
MTVPEQSRSGPAPVHAIVLDASVAVELLAGTQLAEPAAARLRGAALHVPAHFSAEVFSALGRLHRGATLTDDEVGTALDRLAAIPVTEHRVADLLAGAWDRRGRLRLVDALYVELADRLDAVVVTTDLRLARAGDGRVEAVSRG